MSAPPRYGLFRKRLHAFTRELPGVERGNGEALHRARVASRRLREVLPLLEMQRDTSRKLNRRLRNVTKQLGAVRELDVTMLLIEEFQGNSRCPSAALTRVSTAVGQARDAARACLAAGLPAATLERLANRLQRAAKSLECEDAAVRRAGATGETRAWLWALDARLARRAASVRLALAVAAGLYVPKRLHDVRTALKKLRYVVELSTDVGRRRGAPDVVALKRAQDLLGRLHDLEALLAWGREVQALSSLPDLIARQEFGALAHVVEDDCRRLHARYMRERTALIAIADRMGARKPHAAVRLAAG